MTVALAGKDLAARIEARLPGSVVETNANAVVLKPESLLGVARWLKETPALNFNYLNFITAVDFFQYFELVYQVTSLEHNHMAVFKTRIASRENPVAASVVSIWEGADYQEREVYDLMGVRFEGHPNMKRIFLWDGFPGHPLRKDFNGA